MEGLITLGVHQDAKVVKSIVSAADQLFVDDHAVERLVIRLDFAKELSRSPERNHSVKIGKCCEIAVQQGRNPTAGVRSNVDPSTRGLGKLNIFLLKRPRGDGFRQWFGGHIKFP